MQGYLKLLTVTFNDIPKSGYLKQNIFTYLKKTFRGCYFKCRTLI